MEKRTQQISSRRNKHITIGIIPGHFATNHSHINYYVDMDSIKKCYKMCKETAKLIAGDYVGTPIDTIVCLEGTESLGAFIAQELSDGNTHSVNRGNDISIITPELDSNNQMIFRDNTQGMIWGKQVLLLISSASTGWTIKRCMECFKYYNGKLAGVSALFSAIQDCDGLAVHSVFYASDLPEYATHSPSDCPMCKTKTKVDALVNAHGYSKIG